MEGGVVQHYYNEGYGFVRSDRDALADDTQLVAFPLSSCNVQAPPPRVGERVVFSRDSTNPLKAMAMFRIDCAAAPTPPGRVETEAARPTPAPTAHATARQQHPAPPSSNGLLRGFVTHFDDAKGFGFIRRLTPSTVPGDVYFHVTVVENDRTDLLKKGDRVEFAEGSSAKGVRATLVRRATAVNTAPSAPSPQPPPAAAPATYEATIPGVVVSYTAELGYGSIARLDGSNAQNLSFVIGDCDIKHPVPTAGERVMVLETMGQRGPEASVVRRNNVPVRSAAPRSATPPKPKPAPQQKKPSKPVATANVEAQRGDAYDVANAMRALGLLMSRGIGEASAQRARTVYCHLCREEDLIEEIFYVSGCNHAFCRGSIRKYIVGCIEKLDLTPKCPHPQCTARMSDGDLTMVLTLEEQQRYYDKCKSVAVHHEPMLHQCRQEGCRGIGALPPNDPHFVCPLCNAGYCVQCNTRVWHDGLTCAQARQRELDSQLRPDQLRELYKDQEVYQCGRCSFGPIELNNAHLLRYGTHAVASTRTNACPRCGWSSNDIREWPRWNGEIPT